MSSLPCSKFTVFISPIKPVTDKIWIHFVYILSFLCWSLCTRLNFPICLTFPLKDFSYLTVNWKTRGLSKPGHKMINHHGNCLTKPQLVSLSPSFFRGLYFSLFSLSLIIFFGLPEWQCPLFGRFYFLLSGRQAEVWWSVCI